MNQFVLILSISIAVILFGATLVRRRIYDAGYHVFAVGDRGAQPSVSLFEDIAPLTTSPRKRELLHEHRSAHDHISVSMSIKSVPARSAVKLSLTHDLGPPSYSKPNAYQSMSWFIKHSTMKPHVRELDEVVNALGELKISSDVHATLDAFIRSGDINSCTKVDMSMPNLLTSPAAVAYLARRSVVDTGLLHEEIAALHARLSETGDFFAIVTSELGRYWPKPLAKGVDLGSYFSIQPHGFFAELVGERGLRHQLGYDVTYANAMLDCVRRDLYDQSAEPSSKDEPVPASTVYAAATLAELAISNLNFQGGFYSLPAGTRLLYSFVFYLMVSEVIQRVLANKVSAIFNQAHYVWFVVDRE